MPIRIADTDVGKYWVSTVDLQLYSDSDMLGSYFETCVFEDTNEPFVECLQIRYRSRQEAIAGHASVVSALRDGAYIAGGILLGVQQEQFAKFVEYEEETAELGKSKATASTTRWRKLILEDG